MPARPKKSRRQPYLSVKLGKALMEAVKKRAAGLGWKRSAYIRHLICQDLAHPERLSLEELPPGIADLM
jgi:predicted DNA binding CopG/RHH family protein